MQNQIQIFENKEFGNVRTLVGNDGEVFFVGKEIASILGYTDNHCILDHVAEEDRVNSKTQGQNDPEFGQRGCWLINESGLYSLILSSKTEKAKEFKHWVTSEILPSIRKHGGYIAGQENMSDIELLSRALVLANSVIEEKSRMLEHAQPKIEFYDAVTESKDTIDMGKVAKMLNLGIGRTQLFRFLRQKNVLQNNNIPYQNYVNRGWFKCAETKYVTSDNVVHIRVKTVVYQKGIEGIRRLIIKERT